MNEPATPPDGRAPGPARDEGPLADGAALPGLGALAGPVSWAVVLAGLPSLAGAGALGYLALSMDGAASEWLSLLTVLALQLTWVAPAVVCRWTLRAALPQLRAPALRFAVLAPGFLLAFLVAVVFALAPIIAVPALVFGPVPFIHLSIGRLASQS